MPEPFSVRVPVWNRGYSWEDVRHSGRHMRRVMQDVPGSERDAWETHGRVYDPFQSEPALFTRFSEMVPTEKAILKFANVYGTLHGRQEFDSLAEWQRESEGMREAIRLWQAILQENKEELVRHVDYGGRKTGTWIGPLVAFLQTRNPFTNGPDSPILSKPKDLLGWANALLDHVIARCACRTVRLMPIRLSPTALTLQVQVADLLEALWLQFASAVTGQKQYENCKYCGQQFEVAPGVNRMDRVFCSNSCRISAHRRRKATVRKLRAQGLSLRQIAAEVGSDMQTIKKWVTNEKEQK